MADVQLLGLADVVSMDRYRASWYDENYVPMPPPTGPFTVAPEGAEIFVGSAPIPQDGTLFVRMRPIDSDCFFDLGLPESPVPSASSSISTIRIRLQDGVPAANIGSQEMGWHEFGVENPTAGDWRGQEALYRLTWRDGLLELAVDGHVVAIDTNVDITLKPFTAAQLMLQGMELSDLSLWENNDDFTYLETERALIGLGEVEWEVLPAALDTDMDGRVRTIPLGMAGTLALSDREIQLGNPDRGALLVTDGPVPHLLHDAGVGYVSEQVEAPGSSPFFLPEEGGLAVVFRHQRNNYADPIRFVFTTSTGTFLAVHGGAWADFTLPGGANAQMEDVSWTTDSGAWHTAVFAWGPDWLELNIDGQGVREQRPATGPFGPGVLRIQLTGDNEPYPETAYLALHSGVIRADALAKAAALMAGVEPFVPPAPTTGLLGWDPSDGADYYTVRLLDGYGTITEARVTEPPYQLPTDFMGAVQVSAVNAYGQSTPVDLLVGV